VASIPFKDLFKEKILLSSFVNILYLKCCTVEIVILLEN
jgi:hypothetical protein